MSYHVTCTCSGKSYPFWSNLLQANGMEVKAHGLEQLEERDWPFKSIFGPTDL